jgi:hypothetical protein
MNADHQVVAEMAKTESENMTTAETDGNQVATEVGLAALTGYRGLDLGPIDVRLRPW